MTGENSHGTEHAGVVTHDAREAGHDATPAYTKPSTMSEKHVFDVERAFSGSGSEEGTFVTDRKRSRMDVGTMLKGAWSEWWGKTEANAKATAKKLERFKPKEAPTVSAVETRTDVILEAAKHAQQAPRDDHKVVVEKIRTFAHDAEVETGTPFLVKNATPKSAPTWGSTQPVSSSQDTQSAPQKESVPTLDLRARDTESVTLKAPNPLSSYASEQKKVVSPSTLRVANTPQVAHTPPRGTGDVNMKESAPSWSHHVGEPEKPLDLRTKTQPEAPLPRTAPLPPPPQIRVEAPLVRTTPEALPRSVSRESVSVPREETLPREETVEPETPLVMERERPEEVEEEDVRRIQFEEEQETGRINPFLIALIEHRVLLLGTILIVGVVGGVGTAFVMMRGGDGAEVSALTAPRINPSPIRVDSTLDVTVPTPPSTLTIVLKEAVSRGEGAVARVLPSPTTETTLFSLLAPNAPGSFVRNVGEHMVVGSVSAGAERVPFFAVPSVTYDVAFAGMLSWEPSLVSDLAPLFGTAPTGSMLPKDGVVTGVRFVDEATGATSVRTLYDATGRERVVYGFVGDTLIVTTSKEAFGTLVSKLESP